MSFVGRKEESQEFDARYRSTNAELVILYGRRRVGKTAFLQRFMQGKKSFFFSATESEDNEQRERFKQKMLTFGFDGEPSLLNDWGGIFRSLIKLKMTGKALVVIDEFQNLLKGNREIASIIQKIWDEFLSKKYIMLVLCESAANVIENEVIEDKKFFHIHSAAVVKMKELPFKEVMKLFPKYSLSERIVVYSVLGGAPFYLKQFSPSVSLEENLKRSILSPGAILYNETEFILKQDLRETATYNTILSAIAHGCEKMVDISQKTKIIPTKANVYLKNLIDLGIVVKEYSILGPAEKATGLHNGAYRIADNFFRFWYRFVYPNIDQIELGETERLAKDISEQVKNEYASACFVRLCIEYIRERNAANDLPFVAKRVGRIWCKECAVDVGATDGKTLLIGECRWSDQPVGLEILSAMREKVTKTRELSEKEDYVLCLFSKFGFTQALIDESNVSNINLFDAVSMFDTTL
ncbi:MAG: ATP-binding protein [Candidatus Methanoplasma sp.]|nr:ATP-binding protein [Candidatus Methanoplasma sp.]